MCVTECSSRTDRC